MTTELNGVEVIPAAKATLPEPLAIDRGEPGWNSSFSWTLPKLQIAWDSTSLGALKTCPRLYQLSILEGWAPRDISVHLTFGLIYHGALERYDHSKFAGMSHDEAMVVAVQYAMEASWDKKLGKPWCSDHKSKNRLTLIRTIIWYLDQFENDPFQTVTLASTGKPAVELSFRTQLDFKSSTGENFILCGHLDRLAEHQGDIYIMDRKTTTSTLAPDFFEKFSPDNQFSTYTLAGTIIWALPIKGIVVDGAQVAVTFSRFGRGIVDRHQSTLNEWYHDLGLWLGMANTFASMNYWPMNDKACGMYGGCAFRGICSKPPSTRAQWLKAGFTRRIWDPLQVRGDI